MSAPQRRHAGSDFPAWIREIDHTLTVKPQFVVTGNIRDRHLLPLGDPPRPGLVPTVEVISGCLQESGYSLVLRWDVIDGLGVVFEADDGVAAAFLPKLADGAMPMTTAELVPVLKKLVAHHDGRIALIIDYGSRVRVDEQDANVDVHRLLTTAAKLADTAEAEAGTSARPATMFNTVFWLMDREADLPHWLAANGSVRVVSIPTPNLTERTEAAERIAVNLPGFDDLDAAAQSEVYRRFAESTHGMGLRSMEEIQVLAGDGRIPATRIEDAVAGYRVGIVDNPWRQEETLERVRNAEEILSRAVLGQPRAIRKSVDILVRAVAGLSGAQSGGHAGRPQGVLFLAGPTGVGKTELAKSLSALLFGPTDSYTRFDMSEFSAEQSEARLIGAPPGFIGHDAGGELTNAVRQRPFSLLLFDEIEKAHPRILDKFLQILEDGRLTDGSGSTVYFSETVIVFTSNLGIYKTVRTGGVPTRVPIVEPGDGKDIEVEVRTAIHDHFTLEIGRPELLNRIGVDNIVVFDFITHEVGKDLIAKYLRNVAEQVQRQRGFALEYAAGVQEALETACLTKEALAFGGRGIGSALETAFINPLARAVFQSGRTEGTATVAAVVADGDAWTVELR